MSGRHFIHAILVIVLAGCTDVGEMMTDTSVREDANLLSERPDGDAEEIALCLSRELVAPDNLYERAHRDLSFIRAEYGDEHDLNTHVPTFIPPWVPSMILVKFDSATGQQVANGEYHAWDSLNATLGVYEIERLFPTIPTWWQLYFTGMKHPKRLAELYRTLPGVLVTERDPLIYTYYNVFPSMKCRGADTLITYLFGRGIGDCEAGCLFIEYWFFASYDERIDYVGHWARPASLKLQEDRIELPDNPFWLRRVGTYEEEFHSF